MNATGHQKRLFAAGAAAAVILGAASTAALAAAGSASRSLSDGAFPGPACQAPSLPGVVVGVKLSDMGAMMGGPRGPGPMMGDSQWWRSMPMLGMMRLTAAPAQVSAGTVSLRAVNTGAWPHEVMVMPLPAGQSVGQRAIGADGKVDETGSQGEASRTCGAGEGHPAGIAPGATGWTTLHLRPGRYELVCNLPGHYAAGMYTELDVTG